MACEHRGCGCREAEVRRGGKRYCSERCAEVESSGKHEARCPCGHAHCTEKKSGR